MSPRGAFYLQAIRKRVDHGLYIAPNDISAHLMEMIEKRTASVNCVDLGWDVLRVSVRISLSHSESSCKAH